MKICRRHSFVNETSDRGFSLVEILVSVAILSVIMVLLFGFFDQATQAWKFSEKKIDAFREARAAMYYLRRDISALVISTDLPLVHYDNPKSVPPDLYTGGPTPPAAHGDFILFISSQSPEAQGNAKSDLCAVGYYLAYWRAQGGSGAAANNHASFNLHRYFYNSDNTWQNPASAGIGIFPKLTQPGGILFAAAQGSAIGDEVIARNITNFSCVPYDADNNPITAVGGQITERPNHFRISLTAFNFDTAQKFNAQEDWYYDEASATPLERQNAQVFSMKVALP